MIAKWKGTANHTKNLIDKGYVFTIFETNTKKHATFSTKRYDKDLRDLISVRTKTKGNSFHKIGTIRNNRFLHYTSIEGSFEHKIFKLFWEGLMKLHMSANIELWHPCPCRRCGRLLTDPESITHGIGPSCGEKEKKGDVQWPKHIQKLS
jgi:hypothetical protein